MRIIINNKSKLCYQTAMYRAIESRFEGGPCLCSTFKDCVVIHKLSDTGSLVFDIVERDNDSEL